jgi:hypothetical protein
MVCHHCHDKRHWKEPLTVSAAPVTSLKSHIIHKYPNPLQVMVHTLPATLRALPVWLLLQV